MIPALVLTAGLATRLRPLSFVRAKAALPVGGAPLAARVLQSLAAAGVRDAVLNLHHLPETIAGRIGDGTGLGVRVRYSWESLVLGSAGGPRRALPLRGVSSLLHPERRHPHDRGSRRAARRAHALGRSSRWPSSRTTSRRNTAACSRQGRGDRLRAARRHGAVVAPLHGRAGSLDRGVRRQCRPTCRTKTVGALYPALIAAQPGSVRVFETAAEFHDIGTPADYLRTARLFAAREHPALAVGARATIDPSASLDGSVLWDDIRVAARARCTAASSPTVSTSLRTRRSTA